MGKRQRRRERETAAAEQRPETIQQQDQAPGITAHAGVAAATAGPDTGQEED